MHKSVAGGPELDHAYQCGGCAVGAARIEQQQLDGRAGRREAYWEVPEHTNESTQYAERP